MTPESNNIPYWARRERQGDLAWIRENLYVFWTTAPSAFEDVGRGVVVVDTTSQPAPDVDHPFGYFPQAQVEGYGDEDVNRMVSEYDPAQELVLVLLKSDVRTSTYWVHAVTAEARRAEASSWG